MARLPQPGSDAGNWGEILNDFLNQSHASDGLLKVDSVGAPQLKPQSVTNAAIADGTIQESKLSSDIQDKLNVTGAVTEADLTDAVDALTSEIAVKQDKEVGKGLSTSDYTPAEKSKLAGIFGGATQNATDASLRDRSTHTGSQAISTITSLQTTLDNKVDKTNLATYAMGYIVHGAVASTARPSGYSCVTWAGSVQPTNAALNDIWIYRA